MSASLLEKVTRGPWFVVDGDAQHMHAICHDEGNAFPLAYVGTELTALDKDANAQLIALAYDHALWGAAVTAKVARIGDDGTPHAGLLLVWHGTSAADAKMSKFPVTLDAFGCPALTHGLRAALRAALELTNG